MLSRGKGMTCRDSSSSEVNYLGLGHTATAAWERDDTKALRPQLRAQAPSTSLHRPTQGTGQPCLKDCKIRLQPLTAKLQAEGKNMGYFCSWNLSTCWSTLPAFLPLPSPLASPLTHRALPVKTSDSKSRKWWHTSGPQGLLQFWRISDQKERCLLPQESIEGYSLDLHDRQVLLT